MSNVTEEVPLPGPGIHTLLVKVLYTQRETNGVTVLIVGSAISLIAVCLLLANIMYRLIKSLKNPNTVDGAFTRTHISYYFVCLMISDLGQAVGSLMSSRWVMQQAVTLNNYCIVQGAFKNASNVAASLWVLVIAIHTWTLLFLRFKPNMGMFVAAIFGVWSLVGVIVIAGPSLIQKTNLGPYFGISGYWCWIGDNYPNERIGLEYFFMFFSAASSFVLYSLVFMRFRGNVIITGRRVRFRTVKSSMAWKLHTGDDVVDANTVTTMKQMLWYPVVYTIIVFPIALCRFLSWAGHDVPFEATIFSDTVFVLGGFMNVILFVTTRRILPLSSVLPAFFRERFSSSSSIFSAMRAGSVGTWSRKSSFSAADMTHTISFPPPRSGETADGHAYEYTNSRSGSIRSLDSIYKASVEMEHEKALSPIRDAPLSPYLHSPGFTHRNQTSSDNL